MIITRWQAVAVCADQLAQQAGLAQGTGGQDPDGFAAALEQASPWRCDLVRHAIEDIEAMLAAGTTALGVLETRGQDVTVPALALWREVEAAQRSLAELLQSLDRTHETAAD
ncbi:MAG: hypothetical protein ACXIT4_02170 [Erythrobacter sp.]